MTANATGQCDSAKASCDHIPAAEACGGESPEDAPQIVDGNVSMLIAAGAAMAANCETCLNNL